MSATGPLPPNVPAGPAPAAPGQDASDGYGRRSERRTARHRAERSHRSERLGRGILPALAAIIVVVAVMWLWSPFAPDLQTSTTVGGPATTGGPGATSAAVPTSGPVTTSAAVATSPSTTAPPAGPSGSALLVITQDGKATVVALFLAGPKGGVVLGMPGITLLRSGDGFVQLAQAYSPDSAAALAAPVAEALAVPSAAVASIEWTGLRAALAAAAGDTKLPEGLDPQGADAGAVSAVIAATLNKAQAGGAATAGWWGQATLQGQVDAFRASVNAAIVSAGGKPWVGQAITGSVATYGTGETYLEPDLQAAKGLLAGTGARN
jgi:hypothetical protein